MSGSMKILGASIVAGSGGDSLQVFVGNDAASLQGVLSDLL